MAPTLRDGPPRLPGLIFAVLVIPGVASPQESSRNLQIVTIAVSAVVATPDEVPVAPQFVNEPPTIKSGPSSVTIHSGETATLTVVASGSAKLHYQWFVGSSGEGTIIPFAAFPSYTTPPLVATTQYWVRVGNALGSVNSATATVTVIPPFTDPTLTPGSSLVRAIHIVELRSRIDALRIRFGLESVSWTDRTIEEGVTPIKAVHLSELRAALSSAYQGAGRPTPSYTEDVLVPGMTAIKAIHILELRDAVVALE